jgi:hypothetical protein
MATYKMPDGTVVKPENATQKWDEDTRWDGSNHISRATGLQWDHQMLYRSRKGRYWLEYRSQWQGPTPHGEWITSQEATRWLLSQGHELPEELEGYRDQIEE